MWTVQVRSWSGPVIVVDTQMQTLSWTADSPSTVMCLDMSSPIMAHDCTLDLSAVCSVFWAVEERRRNSIEGAEWGVPDRYNDVPASSQSNGEKMSRGLNAPS